jgi:hypothetical protein
MCAAVFGDTSYWPNRATPEVQSNSIRVFPVHPRLPGHLHLENTQRSNRTMGYATTPYETKRPRAFRGLSILDTSSIGQRERRDWATHAYTGGDLPAQSNCLPVCVLQKSVACAGRVLSAIGNQLFRMSSFLGLFVGNQRKLGRMVLFDQDNVPLRLLN